MTKYLILLEILRIEGALRQNQGALEVQHYSLGFDLHCLIVF